MHIVASSTSCELSCDPSAVGPAASSLDDLPEAALTHVLSRVGWRTCGRAAASCKALASAARAVRTNPPFAAQLLASNFRSPTLALRAVYGPAHLIRDDDGIAALVTHLRALGATLSTSHQANTALPASARPPWYQPAGKRGHLSVLQLVLDAGEQPRHLVGALCLAALHGHTSLIRSLMSAGVPIDVVVTVEAGAQDLSWSAPWAVTKPQPDIRARSPRQGELSALQCAARSGQADALSVMLEGGAASVRRLTDLLDDTKDAPLACLVLEAIESRGDAPTLVHAVDVAISKLPEQQLPGLLDWCATAPARASVGAIWVAAAGKEEAFSALVAAGASLTEELQNDALTALGRTAGSGSATGVRLLLQLGVSPLGGPQQEGIALIRAAECRNGVAALQVLLEAVPEPPSAVLARALSAAALASKPDAVPLLLGCIKSFIARIQVKIVLAPQMHQAVRLRQWETVGRLLALLPDELLADEVRLESLALMRAARSGAADALTRLAAAGAAQRRRVPAGGMGMHEAMPAAPGAAPAVEATATSCSAVALLMAVSEGHLECVQVLLPHAVEAADAAGWAESEDAQPAVPAGQEPAAAHGDLHLAAAMQGLDVPGGPGQMELAWMAAHGLPLGGGLAGAGGGFAGGGGGLAGVGGGLAGMGGDDGHMGPWDMGLHGPLVVAKRRAAELVLDVIQIAVKGITRMPSVEAPQRQAMLAACLDAFGEVRLRSMLRDYPRRRGELDRLVSCVPREHWVADRMRPVLEAAPAQPEA